MLSQVTQQGIHVLILRAVDEVAALSLLAGQIGMSQLFEMERQGTGGHVELLCQSARRQAIRPSHNQRPKNPQAHRLRQCHQ